MLALIHEFRFGSFYFPATATTEIYTLSLHDALPISGTAGAALGPELIRFATLLEMERIASELDNSTARISGLRSEEHTSELQSLRHLVCRLLLEKKKLEDPVN